MMGSQTEEEHTNAQSSEVEAIETREWVDSLDYVLHQSGPKRARALLSHLATHGAKRGMDSPFGPTTPYLNTIAKTEQPKYPGDLQMEQRIEALIRWNAMAMVVRANKKEDGIGGHISTYASAATLYEVGFHHFFQGREKDSAAHQIYFQGHASPGIYARAFLEGRLTEEHLDNFRRELTGNAGLSSYPHPWLMPDFWEFPTVSMGLSPIMAIYQARFNRYLAARGLKSVGDSKVWAFLGDGETDEPETLGALNRAARENLDNLIFVINCNLQRLDGPVFGNGKIIQELEGVFRGAGWNVIKLIWGGRWDPLFAKDTDGLLAERLGELVDGEYQKLSVESATYVRDKLFGHEPRLEQLASSLSDEELTSLNRGGHDPEKVYAAYQQATEHKGRPTVILAKTIKGFGIDSAAGKNVTHQQKKLEDKDIASYRDFLNIPISDDKLKELPFYHPGKKSLEVQYLLDQRKHLGGFVPKRVVQVPKLKVPTTDLFEEFYQGSDGREVSTTMAFVRIMAKLLRDKYYGKLIVPIVPDEARTFGMESLFRQFGIYSSVGQLYEPVDKKSLLYYKEAKDGQILEEGITEAGAMSSFIAAGTAYATHGLNTIPFFIYYSMFGFQRIGDLVWAAGDMRCRGFLVGGTAGRTTLSGEGLQHQDGQSHLAALAVPNVMAYDPGFAYETAVIIEEGMRRMYHQGESVFFYITVENENYVMPAMPSGVREGIVKGMYQLTSSDEPAKVHLFGSGPIINETLKAKDLLKDKFDIPAEVWSITSFKELYRDANETERHNRLHPNEEPKASYIESCLKETQGVYVIASDYIKALGHSIGHCFPDRPVVLGTDGFGRSDGRSALRDFFEVDAKHIALAALTALGNKGYVSPDIVSKATDKLEIDPKRENPVNR